MINIETFDAQALTGKKIKDILIGFDDDGNDKILIELSDNEVIEITTVDGNMVVSND